nr:heme ABC exporter ATP-binding protein CcmA [Hyphomicrobium methylovorum]
MEAEDLVVERGGRRVIDGMSFAVGSGEAVVLAGPNGAGKTTLLRTLAGFLRPLAGSIRLQGGDPELTLSEQAHVVGHANAVKSSMTVGENTTFWSEYLTGPAPRPERVSKALQHFGLEDLVEFPAAILSAGQKRRLGLARLLAAHRPLWLLDEPTVSLDSASAERFAAAVNEHTLAGGLAVIATHLPLGLERARTLRIASGKMTA